jgi:hypothetical protein
VVVPTVVVEVEVAIVLVLMLVGAVTVEVDVFKGNLDVHQACAAGRGETRDTTSPMAPVHVAADTSVGTT